MRGREQDLCQEMDSKILQLSEQGSWGVIAFNPSGGSGTAVAGSVSSTSSPKARGYNSISLNPPGTHALHLAQ